MGKRGGGGKKGGMGRATDPTADFDASLSLSTAAVPFGTEGKQGVGRF